MNSQLDNFKSSYSRSFGRRNIVDHPFRHNYFNTEVKNGLKIPIFREKCSSTFKASFGPKNRGDNYFRRFSLDSKPNLRRLHEEYLGNPVKPHETSTTSGTIHGKLKPLFSATVDCDERTKNVICPLKLRDNEKFLISVDQKGFPKLLDIYATTAQLAHIDFFRNRGNGISKNNNDESTKTHFSLSSEGKTLYRQFPKQFRRLPHFGNISTYRKDYEPIFSRHFEFDYEFPTLQK